MNVLCNKHIKRFLRTYQPWSLYSQHVLRGTKFHRKEKLNCIYYYAQEFSCVSILIDYIIVVVRYIEEMCWPSIEAPLRVETCNTLGDISINISPLFPYSPSGHPLHLISSNRAQPISWLMSSPVDNSFISRYLSSVILYLILLCPLVYFFLTPHFEGFNGWKPRCDECSRRIRINNKHRRTTI